jgi:hypothetical protein
MGSNYRTDITISGYSGSIGKIQTVTVTQGGTIGAPQCDFTFNGTTLSFSNTGNPNVPTNAQGFANSFPMTYSASSPPTLTSGSGTVLTKV